MWHGLFLSLPLRGASVQPLRTDDLGYDPAGPFTPAASTNRYVVPVPLLMLDFIVSSCLHPTNQQFSTQKIDLTQVERQVGTAVIIARTGKIEKVRSRHKIPLRTRLAFRFA